MHLHPQMGCGLCAVRQLSISPPANIRVNDRKLMGNHTNGIIFNGVAWVTSVVMIVLTVVLFIQSLFFGP